MRTQVRVSAGASLRAATVLNKEYHPHEQDIFVARDEE